MRVVRRAGRARKEKMLPVPADDVTVAAAASVPRRTTTTAASGEHVGDLVAAAPFLLVLVAAAGALWWTWHHRRALKDGLVRLAERDGLTPTLMPCGLRAEELVDRFEATPSGARRFGVEHGVVGPSRAALAADEVDIELAAFQWWYEERVNDKHRSRYRRRTCTVALARLPVSVPGSVQVRPEGVLGRLGLRRAGDQLESDQFNRRFRVDGSDPTLTVRLLDARVQHHLLESGNGRTLDVVGDLVVLGGSPTHRDTTLPGVIGELPAVRQDLVALLRSSPPAFWRAARPVERDRDQPGGGIGRSGGGW